MERPCSLAAARHSALLLASAFGAMQAALLRTSTPKAMPAASRSAADAVLTTWLTRACTTCPARILWAGGKHVCAGLCAGRLDQRACGMQRAGEARDQCGAPSQPDGAVAGLPGTAVQCWVVRTHAQGRSLTSGVDCRTFPVTSPAVPA
jgi:hypothetical protein